jgi:hypothetical protein
VEQMGSQVEDRSSLLETVQSDKTALSRALSQNKELKNQLAELQNGFVKMVWKTFFFFFFFFFFK